MARKVMIDRAKSHRVPRVEPEQLHAASRAARAAFKRLGEVAGGPIDTFNQHELEATTRAAHAALTRLGEAVGGPINVLTHLGEAVTGPIDASILTQFCEAVAGQIDVFDQLREDALRREAEMINEAMSNQFLRDQPERDRVRREEESLAELRAIALELREERRERARLAAQVRELDHATARYRTGAPGRPGSQHLVLAECRRRAESGELKPTLREEADHLAKWLPLKHTDAAPNKPRTIENTIRVLYGEARQKLAVPPSDAGAVEQH